MAARQLLPRFRAVSGDRKPAMDFAGNPRYRDYLKAVFDFNGHVTAAELQHLVPPHTPTERQQAALARAHAAGKKKRATQSNPTNATEASRRRTRVRREVQQHPSKLHHHDYLRRYGEGNRVYYTLGLRAIEPLVAYFDVDPGRARRLLSRVHEVRKFYFSHSRMIARIHFMTAMAMAKARGAIGFWRHDGQVETDVRFVDARQRRKRVPVIPDAYFSIETPEAQPAYFCLEADRGTTTHERFTTKMVGYYRFWKRPPKRPSRSEEVLQIPHFRVLVVCPSMARLDGLYAATTKALERDPIYKQSQAGVAKKGLAQAPSGIAFVHEDAWQTEDGGAVFPDLSARFIPFV